ncbi:MAG: acyl-CoA thioesterase [Desulfobacter sp.]|nr:MAG: acyl-CoA thioesterase [Desulfobacter sp.]
MKQAIDAPTQLKDTHILSPEKWHLARVVPQVSDTDYGGGIYHGKYFALYNQARDIFMADLGVPYLSLMDRGVNLSVAELHTRFFKPVFYGDLVVVHTRISWLRSRSFGVEQKMVCTDERTKTDILANQVEMNLVCTGKGAGAQPLPADLRRGILDYYRG